MKNDKKAKNLIKDQEVSQELSEELNTASIEIIKDMIYVIRGQKVMLDSDLATLYGVSTKQLNQGVKRNVDRFPNDFMFQLTKEEYQNLRSQIVTSSWGGYRYLPYAFTEQGVAMLSSVLNSDRAIKVNITIMRTFTRLRQLMVSYADLKEKIEKMESKYDGQFRAVFIALKELVNKSEAPKQKIGFH